MATNTGNFLGGIGQLLLGITAFLTYCNADIDKLLEKIIHIENKSDSIDRATNALEEKSRDIQLTLKYIVDLIKKDHSEEYLKEVNKVDGNKLTSDILKKIIPTDQKELNFGAIYLPENKVNSALEILKPANKNSSEKLMFLRKNLKIKGFSGNSNFEERSINRD